MSDTKFTPGPWHVCNKGGCSCFTVMCSDHPIAQVTHGDWGDDYPAIRLVGDSSFDRKAEAYIEQITYGHVNDETARANWHLIAAAPALYAALVETLEIASRNEDGDWAIRARAALSAALSQDTPSLPLKPQEAVKPAVEMPQAPAAGTNSTGDA